MTPLKKCTKCGEEKPATKEFFYTHKSAKLGFRPDCIKCTKLSLNEYYARNKDKFQEYGRSHRQTASYKNKRREWDINHKDKIKENKRQAYSRDIEKHRAKSQAVSKKRVESLSDIYIKHRLKIQFGHTTNVTEYIEIKRKKIKALRLIRQLKHKIKQWQQ